MIVDERVAVEPPAPVEQAPSAQRRRRRARVGHPATGHVVFLLAVAGVWAWSVARVDESVMTEFGLVTVLPVSLLVALVAALIGFTIAAGGERNGRILGAYVVAVTVMVHGLPPLVYQHLRFSWAWKHVGIVEFIQRTGGVDPNVAVHPVYHSWPGFFGLNAWITEASYLESALSYAAWAPILFDLLFVGGLYLLARAVTPDPRLRWTGVLFFVLGNWVGQDYFAPQALAYFFYLVAIALVLRYYATPTSGVRLASDLDDETIEAGSVGALVVTVALTGILLAIAISHQITPIATILVLGALRVTRVVRVTWPLVAIVLFTAAWTLGPARDFVLGNLGDVVEQVGGVDATLDDNLVGAELFSQSQLRISQVARLLSAAMAAFAGLGWWRRSRHKVPSRWLLVVSGAPVLLILLSSYGGEVLFRIYLFALPFAALLAASLWFPSDRALHRRVGSVSLGMVLILLLATLLVADFGADNRQVFDDDEYAAADYLFRTAQPGALIVEGSRDYPRQHRNYEQYVYLPLDRSRPDTLEGLLADPAGRIAGWMRDEERYSGGFVIITQSQRESVTALGTLLSPTLDRVEQSLLESPEFEIVFEAGDARVFAPKGQQ